MPKSTQAQMHSFADTIIKPFETYWGKTTTTTKAQPSSWINLKRTSTMNSFKWPVSIIFDIWVIIKVKSGYQVAKYKCKCYSREKNSSKYLNHSLFRQLLGLSFLHRVHHWRYGGQTARALQGVECTLKNDIIKNYINTLT